MTNTTSLPDPIRFRPTFILAPVALRSIIRYQILDDSHIEVSGDDLAQWRARNPKTTR